MSDGSYGAMMAEQLIPGAQLKHGVTTLAVRQLEPWSDDDAGPRFAVLCVEPNVQYIVWTAIDIGGRLDTFNGTYLRLFVADAERLFLRALGDWLARV